MLQLRRSGSIFLPNIFLPNPRFMGSHHGPNAAHGDHEPKAEDPKIRGGQRFQSPSLSAPHLWVLIRRFMERIHGPPTAVISTPEPEWEGAGLGSGLGLGLRAGRDATVRPPAPNPNPNLALPLNRFMGRGSLAIHVHVTPLPGVEPAPDGAGVELRPWAPRLRMTARRASAVVVWVAV